MSNPLQPTKVYTVVIIFILALSCNSRPETTTADQSSPAPPPTIDTIGVNQSVGKHGDSFELHTWVKTADHQFDMHRSSYATNYFYADYYYDSHKVVSFNEALGLIHIEKAKADSAYRKYIAQEAQLDSLKKIIKSSVKQLLP